MPLVCFIPEIKLDVACPLCLNDHPCWDQVSPGLGGHGQVRKGTQHPDADIVLVATCRRILRESSFGNRSKATIKNITKLKLLPSYAPQRGHLNNLQRQT
eukprot:3061824-Amphidinium_carterae.1